MQLARAARKLGHHILLQHRAILLYRASAGLGTGPAVHTGSGVCHAVRTRRACSGFACGAAASSVTSAPSAARTVSEQRTEAGHPSDSNLEQADARPAAVPLSDGGPRGSDRHSAAAPPSGRQPGQAGTPASLPDTPRTGPQLSEPRGALDAAAGLDTAPGTQLPPATAYLALEVGDACATPRSKAGAAECAETAAPVPEVRASGLLSEESDAAVASRCDARGSGELGDGADSNVHTAGGSNRSAGVVQASAADTGTYISELRLWCAPCCSQ